MKIILTGKKWDQGCRSREEWVNGERREKSVILSTTKIIKNK